MNKILHVDADCFYAAIEARDNPQLLDQAVAVGGDPGGRGVIATCNYVARRFGVKSAMASAHAKKLCPSLIFIRPRMDVYRATAEQMRDIFNEYSECVETVSLDEAYLDVSNSDLCYGSGTLIAKEISSRVKREVGISVSAGVSSIKFLAKVASDWRKPEGIFVIPPHDVESFLRVLPITRLPGVGKVTAIKLEQLGVYSCGDAKALGRDVLVRRFGEFGGSVFDMSSGHSDKPVRSERTRKSISVERTFSENYGSIGQCGEHVRWLMARLHQRIASLQGDVCVKNQFVKLKFDDFSQTTMTMPLRAAIQVKGRSDHEQAMPAWACGLAADYQRLLNAAWHRAKRPVRLIGIGLALQSQIDQGEQLCFAFADDRAQQHVC